MENRLRSKKAMVTDMTGGSGFLHIIYFAVPLLIGNLFQQIYSVVDTMIAGYNLGDSAIAAIGSITPLSVLITDFAIGMNGGFGLIVAKYFGAHDGEKLKKAIAGMMILDAAIVMGLTALSLVFLRPIMHLMRIPEGIYEEAYSYIVIICLGVIATVTFNMTASILRSMGNSRAPIYFLAISCVINIVFDVVFVVVLRVGLIGTAIATVIAQAISALLGAIYLYRNYREILPRAEDFYGIRKNMLELWYAGMTMALMECVVDLGSVIFQSASNSLGEIFIAANTGARRLIDLFMQPFFSLAMALATFAGQNHGAGKYMRIRKAIKRTLGMEIVWAVVCCVLIFMLGEKLIFITTGSTDVAVVSNAVMNLRFHFSLYPELGILLCMRSVMQAVGWKSVPIVSSCFELVIKLFSAIYFIPHMGFLGICMTEPTIWAVCMAFLLAMYFFNRNKYLPVEKQEEVRICLTVDR